MIARRALLRWLVEPEAEEGHHSAGPVEEGGPLLAHIWTSRCLAGGASFCSSCVERCPQPGALHLRGRAVEVVPPLCTGCGLCIPTCPAPGGAITLERRP